MSLLKVSDVARLLQVRPKRVRELIHGRHLNASNITPGGGRATYRIDPEDLRAFREHQQAIPRDVVRRRRNVQRPVGRVIEFIK